MSLWAMCDSTRCSDAEGEVQEGEVPVRPLVCQLHRGARALVPHALWWGQQDPSSRRRPLLVSSQHQSLVFKTIKVIKWL